MSLDEFLSLVQRGNVQLVTRYDSHEGRVVLLCHAVAPEDVIEAIREGVIEVIRAHQGEIFYLVQSSDVLCCMDTAHHQRYHVPAILDEEEYVMCSECARLRAAANPTEQELAGYDKIDLEAERKGSML